MTLFGVGEERIGGATVDGTARRRRGFTQAQIDRVLEKGGSLPLPVLLRCRVRYFTEGAALGGRGFLEEFLKEHDDGAGYPVKPAGASGAAGLVTASRRRRRAITAPG